MRKRKMAMMLASAMMLTALGGSVEALAEAASAGEEYEVTDLLGRTVTIPAETSSYACIGPGCLRL